MNDKQFESTYCSNCGSQRCEGIGTEWFEGCKYRWNHDSYDAATEIERLNKQIMNMAAELNGINRSRCGKCVYELYCSKNKDNERKCPDYKRDAPDGGYYG